VRAVQLEYLGRNKIISDNSCIRVIYSRHIINIIKTFHALALPLPPLGFIGTVTRLKIQLLSTCIMALWVINIYIIINLNLYRILYGRPFGSFTKLEANNQSVNGNFKKLITIYN
jgi:hypothetical protein